MIISHCVMCIHLFKYFSVWCNYKKSDLFNIVLNLRNYIKPSSNLRPGYLLHRNHAHCNITHRRVSDDYTTVIVPMWFEFGWGAQHNDESYLH